MQLWSGVLSNNAAKVRIVLAEKGIDVEIHEVPWTKESLWEPKPAEFLAVSPRGEVPVLIDDGFVVHDSTVINEYLEERYPEPALFPADTRTRAECRIWEDEGDFNQKHVAVLISDFFLGEPEAPLTPAAREAIDALGEFYKRLDSQLDGREYLCGGFSVADISVFMTLAFAVTLGAEITQENLEAWYERMMARPVIAREYQAILAAAAAL